MVLLPSSRPLAVLLLAGLSVCSCITVNLGNLGQGLKVTERRIEGTGDEKIALIALSGVITEEPLRDFWGDKGNLLERFVMILRQIEADEKVKAVVLKVNSPGGEVTTSDVLYRELLATKERRHLPLIACFMDVAASGGYYVAMAADLIVAHPTGVTGSIGVVQFGFSAKQLLTDKLGLSDQTISSGKNKDMGNPFKELNDAQRAIVQGVIDEIYGQFLRVVERGRPQLDPKELASLADGRIFTAQQAKDLGLVDQVGYLDQAISLAEQRAGISGASVIMYEISDGRIYNRYSQPGARRAGATPDLLRLVAQGPILQPWLLHLGPELFYR